MVTEYEALERPLSKGRETRDMMALNKPIGGGAQKN
jgi:hypothetical protein